MKYSIFLWGIAECVLRQFSNMISYNLVFGLHTAPSGANRSCSVAVHDAKGAWTWICAD